MDLTYSPEEEAFRLRVRQWIAEHAPARTVVRDLEAARAWQRTLHGAGFLGVGWPAEYGGPGLSYLDGCYCPLMRELERQVTHSTAWNQTRT